MQLKNCEDWELHSNHIHLLLEADLNTTSEDEEECEWCHNVADGIVFDYAERPIPVCSECCMEVSQICTECHIPWTSEMYDQDPEETLCNICFREDITGSRPIPY
jgi:formylmethanofuran dehydrogenase subunit E